MKRFSNEYQTYALLIFAFTIFLTACKKQDNFLNVKSNLHDVTPKTLSDLQAVLDNAQVMNGYGSIIGLVGSDNIYIPDANLDAADQTSRNAYLWQKDIYQGSMAFDWYYCYQEVEYANIALNGLSTLSQTNEATGYNNIKGSALFYRAFAFYQLSQIYCKPFNTSTASTDLGLPLRTSADVNEKFSRGTLQNTYTQIINDLKSASTLLPLSPLYKTRPSLVAVNALLAKVYLNIGDYPNALKYADLTLKAFPNLLDYNTLNIKSSFPFPTFTQGNPEVIFHASSYGLTTVWSASSVRARLLPALFQTYDINDIRKSVFFSPDGSTGLFKFKGSYTSTANNFCGIATDELYLIRSECSARLGNNAQALSDLNLLLKNRYLASSFQPITISDNLQLLTRILLERRKEMPCTGNIRWEDLRRENLESGLALDINRTYHGTNYNLIANDSRYVLPIPNDEIILENLQQNQR